MTYPIEFSPTMEEYAARSKLNIAPRLVENLPEDIKSKFIMDLSEAMRLGMYHNEGVEQGILFILNNFKFLVDNQQEVDA